MTQSKTTANYLEPFTTSVGRVLCAAVVAMATACGGGGGGGSTPTPAANANPPVVTTPPSAAAPLNSETALNLFESARVLASLSAAALYHATIDYQLWTTGPCGGSLLATLDGGAVPAGILPVGSHTLSVTFKDCVVDALVGTTLSGTSSAAYTSVDWRDVTALVSANSMRGTLAAFRSGLNTDVTSDGSGTWRHVTAGADSTTTYTPTVGSRLVNNSTGNSATFIGGSYSIGSTSPPPGSSSSGWQDFNNLAVAINGTNYILHGTLQSVYGFVGNYGTHTGEVRITSNGTLVARIYGLAYGQPLVEVLSALEPF